MRHIHAPQLPASGAPRHALQWFCQEAHRLVPDRIGRIIVYGSMARGESGPESDLDLWVDWKGEEPEGRRVLGDLAARSPVKRASWCRSMWCRSRIGSGCASGARRCTVRSRMREWSSMRESVEAPLIRRTKGIHLVVSKFVDSALIIRAKDGRTFFTIPWRGSFPVDPLPWCVVRPQTNMILSPQLRHKA